jgi:hypothetical protein
LAYPGAAHDFEGIQGRILLQYLISAENKADIHEKEGGTDDSNEREQCRQNGNSDTGKGGRDNGQTGYLSPQRVRRQCEAVKLYLSDE